MAGIILLFSATYDNSSSLFLQLEYQFIDQVNLSQ